MNRMKRKPFSIRALAVGAVLAASVCFSCGERTPLVAGEVCNATSECETGLLCNFAAEPAVCAGEGTGERPADASVADSAVAIPDANVPDAAPPDAAPDAAL